MNQFEKSQADGAVKNLTFNIHAAPSGEVFEKPYHNVPHPYSDRTLDFVDLEFGRAGYPVSLSVTEAFNPGTIVRYGCFFREDFMRFDRVMRSDFNKKELNMLKGYGHSQILARRVMSSDGINCGKVLTRYRHHETLKMITD